jgi:hypothetical protein
MTRHRPFPPRPAKPFRISSLTWLRDNVANHTRAGFGRIPDDHIRWHYRFYLEFLRRLGYLVGDDASHDLRAKQELWSNELTSEGYRFVQYSDDRWLARLRRNDDEARGLRFLEKWHASFKEMPKDAFDWREGA